MYIRTASERDLAAVRDLLVETWHATYDSIYGAERVTEITNDWHSIPSLKARLTRPNSEFVLADDGREICGMAFAVGIDGGKLIMLHQLYVLPSRQGAGIGSILLDAIEESFPDAERIRIEVEAANSPAIDFYCARGFARAGQTGDCGGEQSGIPALIYEKPLG
jgi:ribosomal protein S18 acetylase RimI-like enzyme